MSVLLDNLNKYYSSYREDLRLMERENYPEFYLTIKYIEKYASPPMKILDIGAGPGVYSEFFAKKGYSVTSVELADSNYAILKSKTEQFDNWTAYHANALDLNMIENDVYDITLLFGPMYHLFDIEEQKKALNEAIRVTKPSGKIFVAYILNDALIVKWGFLREKLIDAMNEQKIDKYFNRVSDSNLFLFNSTTVPKIESLIQNFDLKQLKLVATDGLSLIIDDKVKNMNDELYSKWLEYLEQICERKDLLGYSYHLLQICEKNG